MRPRGSYGEIATALLSAAASGPGPVRELAMRAQVGYDAAHYTCSRLVRTGALAVVQPGRPAIVALPPAVRSIEARLDDLNLQFWGL